MLHGVENMLSSEIQLRPSDRIFVGFIDCLTTYLNLLKMHWCGRES